MLTALALGALLAAPQGPLALDTLDPSGLRVRFDAIEGVTDVSLWLGVEVGTAHDPLGRTGLAQVVAEAIRGEMPRPQEFAPREVLVLPDATLIGVAIRREDAGRELERFATWLSDGLASDDDAILRARGRALLRADDELEVLPGPLLRDRAEALLAGASGHRPSAGIPAEIRALSPDAVRAWVRETWRADRAFVVALGACDEPLRMRAEGALGALPAGGVPLVVPPAPAVTVDARTPHPLVAAPFVAFALPAPRWEDEGYLPFLLASEVARGRVAHAFSRRRGGEDRAEFAPIAYEVGRMPRTLCIQRRGEDGEAVGAVRAEIERVVEALRSGGIAKAEVEAARSSLRTRLALPPFSGDEAESMRRFPTFLLQRGGTVARYVVHGWPDDLAARVAELPGDAAQKALEEAFAPERGAWLALVPE